MINGILGDNIIPYVTKDIMSGIVTAKTTSSLCVADIYISEHGYKKQMNLSSLRLSDTLFNS